MNEYYAEVVHEDDIDHDSGVTTINREDATTYKGLQSVALPANGGNMNWAQTIVLTHGNGGVERIEGHLVDSGEVNE